MFVFLMYSKEYMKKQVLVKRLDYSTISSKEHLKRSNRHKDLTPNKPKTYLDTIDSKSFVNINHIPETIINECIIMNSNVSSRIWDGNLMQYCWDFLKGRDKGVYAFFRLV